MPVIRAVLPGAQGLTSRTGARRGTAAAGSAVA